WSEAGRRARERFANAEAVGHITKGLTVLEQVPISAERDRNELILQANLGTALGASRGYTPPEVGRAFARARELCDRVENAPEKFLILFGVISYYMMRAEYATSQELADQILTLARTKNDSGDIVMGLELTSANALFTGDIEQALDYAKRGCFVYIQAGRPSLGPTYGFDPGILCFDWCTWTLLMMGYPDKASIMCADGIQYATQQSHVLTVATTKVHAAVFHALRGDAPTALEHAAAAADFCKENSI